MRNLATLSQLCKWTALIIDIDNRLVMKMKSIIMYVYYLLLRTDLIKYLNFFCYYLLSLTHCGLQLCLFLHFIYLLALGTSPAHCHRRAATNPRSVHPNVQSLDPR